MTLLTAHLINGQKVGIETSIPAAITEPFKIENTISPGYADVSTIRNWHKYGINLNRDYIFVRKEIKSIVEQIAIEASLATIADPPVSPNVNDQYYISSPATGNWAGYEGQIALWTGSMWVKEPTHHVGYRLLSTEEKIIVSSYKIGSVSDHFSEFGVPSVVDIGEEYHLKSIEARKARMLRATVEVYNRLLSNYAQVLQQLTYSQVGNMIASYKDWGIKGTVEDYNVDFNPNPTPGIIDYALARAPFDGTQANLDAGFPSGLANQLWITVDGKNMTEFSQELYDILVTGIYH